MENREIGDTRTTRTTRTPLTSILTRYLPADSTPTTRPSIATEPTDSLPDPSAPADPSEAPARVPVGMPDDAVIVLADADGYTDRAMRGPPHMWCWVNGPKWFYVKDYPIPVPRKVTK